MDVVERILVQLAALAGVLEAVPTGADTDGRGEPLAQIKLRGKAHLTEAVALLKDGIDTGTDVDERVVENTVGHIGATDDFTAFTAVVVLLRIRVEGEEETCSRKDSDEFDGFHNTMLSLIASSKGSVFTFHLQN